MKEIWRRVGIVGGLMVWLLLAWLAGTWLGLSGTKLWLFRAGLAVLGVCIVVVYQQLRAKKTKPPGGAQPAAAGAQGGAAEQVDLLFRESEARLTSSAIGRAGKMRGLPAIFLLGETGTAKTTVLVHSGLEPELLGGRAYQENLVAPTRVANFWFAQGTVFVDLAGGLLGDAEARARLLKRLTPAKGSTIFGRGTQAPRAAVVCVDCEGFLRSGAAEAAAKSARVLREALGEICQSWGINLPVYVLFTKMDRIPFFSEYVGNFTNSEAGLVFGAALPMQGNGRTGVYAEQETRRLGETVQVLFHSLADKRPEFLGREHDGEKLPAIYQHPREFRKLQSLLVQFLVDLGRPSQLRTNPFLRGFYFTGVRAVIVSDVVAARPRTTEEQQPLLADATGIFRPFAKTAPEAAPRAAGGRKVPQWVFLSHLFSDVILKDSAALASSSTSVKTDFWRRVLLATVALLGLVFGIGWIVSHGNNRTLKAEALSAAEAIPSTALADSELAPTASLERLDALRAVLAKLSQYEQFGPPMSLRWGLYTGHDLYEPVYRIYFGHFRRLLLGQAQGSLLHLISRPSGAQALGYKPVYDALKAYLITTSHPEKSTVEFLPPVLMDHWTAGRAVDAQRSELARWQFTFYAEQLRIRNPYPSFAKPDDGAVTTARRYLSQFAATETLYQAMLARASEKYATFRFNQQFPGSADVVRNNFPVPGAFTRGGWMFMQQAIQNPDEYFSGERWVMGDQAFASLDRTKLQQELQARYRQDFLKTWREYLKSTTVVRYAGIPDAADKLAKLSDIQSPLLEVLCVASQNTSVDVPEVASVFQPAQFVTPPGCQEKLTTQANAGYMEGLIKLKASLEQLSGGAGSEPVRAEAVTTATSAQIAAQIVAQNFRIDKDGQTHAVVKKLLEDPIIYAQNALGNVDKDAINASGKDLCAQLRPLMSKYPFNPKATAQASLAELDVVFRPQTGALWTLYEENLTKILVRQGSEFVPKASGNLAVSPAFLSFFRQAVGVSNAFYRNNSPQPQLTFSLKPYPTEGIENVVLAINGQTMSTGNSSGKAWQFAWPGTGPQETKMTVKIAGGSELAYPSYSGLWAVFQFFAYADRWQASGADIALEWTLRTAGGAVTLPKSGKPVTVRFDLNMQGAPPILRPGYLASLNCVSTVVR